MQPKNSNNYIKIFWQLCRGYWRSEEKWKALGLLAVVIGLNFAAVYLLVQINNWYNSFYNALQGYQEELFWPLVGEFTALAFIYIVIDPTPQYITSKSHLSFCLITISFILSCIRIGGINGSNIEKITHMVKNPFTGMPASSAFFSTVFALLHIQNIK